MNCRFVLNSLSAYLDRELPAETLVEIRAHLSDCARCRTEEQELRSLKALLSGMHMPTPPAQFEERLHLIVQGKVKAKQENHWGRTAVVFAGIAAASMFITLRFLASTGASPSSKSSEGYRRLAFEVQRDQAYNASADPISGAPVLSASPYGP